MIFATTKNKLLKRNQIYIIKKLETHELVKKKIPMIFKNQQHPIFWSILLYVM